jgi:tetratricopeptide (TPR) repeat protein
VLRRAIPALIVAGVFAAFWPALTAGWTNWDDPTNFLQNPHYRGLGAENLAWMWTNFTGHYMPLTWMTLGLDYELWGMAAGGYHFTSLVFHAANAVLAFLFLRRLLARLEVPGADDASRAWAAAAGAAAYALHPLRVESVAWITERRDLVAGLFFLLSLLAYLRAHPADGPRSGRWLAASVALFAASILSKAIGMTLPLALLVLDAGPLRRFRPGADWKAPLLEKIPFLAVAAGAVALTFLGQSAAGALQADPGPLARWHNLLAQPPYRLWFYLSKTFLPAGLGPLYPYHAPAALFPAPHAIAALATAALAALLVALRRRLPGAAWTVAAFVALLVPVLGPVQAGPHFAADRYTYLAALPWSVALAALLLAARPRVPTPALVAAGLLLAAALGVLSHRQTRIWGDPELLWTRAIAFDASTYIPFGARGAWRASQGRFAGALEDFTEADRLDPRSGQGLANRAMARLRMGDPAGAWADQEEALKRNPASAKAWQVQGEIHFARGKLKEAVEAFTRALAVDRTLPELWNARARARGAMGDLRGALDDSALALTLNPANVEAWINRAVARGELGDLDGAVADYSRAIALAPGVPEAWGGRAKAQMLRRAWKAAAADFEQALQVAPPAWPFRADAQAGLAEARRNAGRR